MRRQKIYQAWLKEIGVSAEEWEIFLNELENILEQKQDKLINQQNIKSINGETILGSGNINIGESSNFDVNLINLNERVDYKTNPLTIGPKTLLNKEVANNLYQEKLIPNGNIEIINNKIRAFDAEFDNAKLLKENSLYEKGDGFNASDKGVIANTGWIYDYYPRRTEFNKSLGYYNNNFQLKSDAIMYSINKTLEEWIDEKIKNASPNKWIVGEYKWMPTGSIMPKGWVNVSPNNTSNFLIPTQYLSFDFPSINIYTAQPSIPEQEKITLSRHGVDFYASNVIKKIEFLDSQLWQYNPTKWLLEQNNLKVKESSKNGKATVYKKNNKK